MVVDVNRDLYGDHFIIYTNVKSCCGPETDTMLYVNCILMCFLKILFVYFKRERKGRGN